MAKLSQMFSISSIYHYISSTHMLRIQLYTSAGQVNKSKANKLTGITKKYRYKASMGLIFNMPCIYSLPYDNGSKEYN